MLRFVYIGDQINEGKREFAYFDTVRDEFLTARDGSQTFDSVKDLREVLPISHFDSDRILRLIPDWYLNGGEPS